MPDAHANVLTPPCRSTVDPTYRPAGRRVAYVADPGAVTAAATLFGQKGAIELYALARSMPLDGWVVDSGTASSAAGIALGLHDLICSARRGEVDAIVVEHVSRFAIDYALALRIAAALTTCGAEVHEARGGAVRVQPDLAARIAADVPPSSRALTACRERLAVIGACRVGRRRSAWERML